MFILPILTPRPHLCPVRDNLTALPFNEERALFDLKLLRDVAFVRKARTIVKPVGDGEKKADYSYPLNGITYCAHCEQLAYERRDPKLRSRLGGMGHNNISRYRHKSGVLCGCTNKSVRSEIYESAFARILELLTIRPEAVEYMVEMQIQSDKLGGTENEQIDLETQKLQAIALCRRRIDAAVTLYGDGRIDKEEYRRRVETNEREISHWEARTSETEKAAMELAMCVEAVNRFARLWEISSDEDKQGMARSLFSYIVFNLDTQRIVDFRLKPWADRFLMLRSALYEDEGNENTGNSQLPASQEVYKAVPHRGLYIRGLPVPERGAYHLLFVLYLDDPTEPVQPTLRKSPSKTGRNQEIRNLYEQGWTVPQLAKQYSISIPRVYQILQSK